MSFIIIRAIRALRIASANPQAASTRLCDALEKLTDSLNLRRNGRGGMQVEFCDFPFPQQVPRGRAETSAENGLAGLLSGIWFAVPKRKVCTNMPSVRRCELHTYYASIIVSVTALLW